MRVGQRLAAAVILCAAVAVSALLYPHHEEAGTGTISSGEIADGLSASCAQLILDKSEFYEGERIRFMLRNECNYRVTLRNSAPWEIRDELGGEVYSPIALQVVVEVDPGGSEA